MVQGLWNIGGINLPDFSISEKLGIGPKNAAVNPAYNKLTTNYNAYNDIQTGLKNGGLKVNSGQATNTTVRQPSNTSGGGLPPQTGGQPSGGGQPEDPYAQIRADISNAWDNYLGSINDIGNTYLPEQRTAQENIINSQYDQGVNQVNSQKASSLRDITDNISNAFKAGNNFLGSRGAGDSSAANQYQYALSREAAKQTGRLNEFVNTQINNLGSVRDQQINQVAVWFSQQQQAIRTAIAQGQFSKSQDINNLSKSILDQALAAKNEIESQANARYNTLLQWAANNSTNISQLKSNIASIPQALQAPQIDSSGNLFITPTGYGSTTDKNKGPLFQNPAWF